MKPHCVKVGYQCVDTNFNIPVSWGKFWVSNSLTAKLIPCCSTWSNVVLISVLK